MTPTHAESHELHCRPIRTSRDSDIALTTRQYNDEEINELKAMPKRVTNPGARWASKPGHRQRNFVVAGLQDTANQFQIYQRQSEADEHDFSCGIAFLPTGGQRLTLARYNGPSHIHGDIAFRPHIHRATARAMSIGKKPEAEAEETNRFTTLEGAFRCLFEDFSLSGITPPEPDQARLL